MRLIVYIFAGPLALEVAFMIYALLRVVIKQSFHIDPWA